MKIICPSCQSTNIKKNGYTYYRKQNHRCKDCNRQFVLNNTHTKTTSTRNLVKQCLKERLSLRAICRIFKLSFNWLHNFARFNWEQTPSNLGLDDAVIERIKTLQVFGIQADEMWSFVQKKIEKRWIWIAYDPVHRLVVAFHIGKRDKIAAKEFWKKIPISLRGCNFETDDWKAYESIIPSNQHKVGKYLTYYIEGFNATVRARVSRLVRKTLSFSKLDLYHDLSIGWFFWQLNLEKL
jgi:IS1 family transposase